MYFSQFRSTQRPIPTGDIRTVLPKTLFASYKQRLVMRVGQRYVLFLPSCELEAPKHTTVLPSYVDLARGLESKMHRVR